MKKIFLVTFFLVLCLSGQVFCLTAARLVLQPQTAWQGKVIKIKLLSAEAAAKADSLFLGQRFKCYKEGDDFEGVIGVPLDQKTGYYNLKLIVTQKDGSTKELLEKVKVGPTKFPFSKFWLKPAKKKLLKRDLINREWAKVDRALRIERSARYCQGKFALPVKGRITQGFGHQQIVNGKRMGNHRGVDFSVPIGTEIRAPNDGRVIFVDRLKVFGGIMVLDHGQGIHTIYMHLSRIYWSVGTKVKKGQVIGLSGDSGVSSGPHLHWGMSVHNLRVDPMQWVKYEI